MESCAVLAETMMYPSIKQYLQQYYQVVQYPDGPMDYNYKNTSTPDTSIYYIRWYSTWVVPRYMFEKYGIASINKLYESFVPTSTDINEQQAYMDNYIGIYNIALANYKTTFSETCRDVYIGLAMMAYGVSDSVHGYQNASTIKSTINSVLGRSITYEKTFVVADTLMTYNSLTDDGNHVLMRHGCDNIKITSATYDYTLTLEKQSETSSMEFVLVRFDKSIGTSVVQLQYPELKDGKYVFNVQDCKNMKTAVLLAVNMNNAVNSRSVYYNLTIVPNTNAVEENGPVTDNSLIKNVKYSNPSNGSTSFSFDLTKSGSTGIDLVDILGNVVSTVSDGMLSEGHQSFDINAIPANGLYFIRVRHSLGAYMYPMTIAR
jgi:hypothetical protein